jgi:hypothetical protein
MCDDELDFYAEELAKSLDVCVSAVPEIVKFAIESVPAEHRKINVVAMLLVTAAKTVLASHGFNEDKQVAFVSVAAKSMVHHPELDISGVVQLNKRSNSN